MLGACPKMFQVATTQIDSVSLQCTVSKLMKAHVQHFSDRDSYLSRILHLPEMQRSTNAGTRVASTDKNI